MKNLQAFQDIKDVTRRILFRIIAHERPTPSDMFKAVEKPALFGTEATTIVDGFVYRLVPVICADGWQDCDVE